MNIFKSKFLIFGPIFLLGLIFLVDSRPVLASFFSNTKVDIIPALPTPELWTMPQKIIEAEILLKDITLFVGDTDVKYTETRFGSIKGAIATSTKNFKEPIKQIALAVLNTNSGQVQKVLITKIGADLIASAGWNIEVLQRANGIRWNGRNTAYRINSAPPTGASGPGSYIVIADVYPNEKDTLVLQKNKAGKKVYLKQRTITYDLYAPYSPDLHSSDLVKSGQDYTAGMVSKALADLRMSGTKSRALTSSLVADVFASRSVFFEHIPLLEQTDLTEFEIDPVNTIERAQVIIGANQDQAFNITCNSSSACGWLQFTPGTYATIVKDYPSAKLIKDFKTGAANHINSMKAAILLYDENLKGLISSTGQKVLTDPRLEEYLASSYNGAPKHTYASLKASILSGIQDWIDALTSKRGGLKDETKGYLVKLRYLQQHGTPLTAVNS
jgi:hypothetical protein